MMPDRIIRDELLHSERYWSVGIEAQRLFVHLLLNADNLARYSGKNYTIRSACYPGQAVDHKLVEKLISDLADADLIRLYVVNQERYIFIPRFKQRLRYLNSKYPEPPKEINDIATEKSDYSQTTDRPQSAEVKRSEEVPYRTTKKPVVGKKVKVVSDQVQALRASTWESYSTAYFERYKVDPVRNAQVNSMLAKLVDRLGSDAPHVAAYYLTHDRAFYVGSKHSVNQMLMNAEGLRTEWATGDHTTDTVARRIDQGQAQKNVWRKIAQETKEIS